MIRLVIILLIAATMACSLSSQGATPKPPTPFVPPATNTSAPTPTGPVAAVPTPTPTVRPTTSGGGTTPVCTPRADWPLYAVVSGDTLGSLAQRTGSTVAQLVSANCLNNANQIQVGQLLRVPRQPDPVIIPTTAVGPGPLLVSPFLNFDGLTYFVQPFTTVYIAWPDAARLGSTQVEFLFHPDGDPIVLSLGTDYDLAYDAGLSWTVPGNTRGELFASGRGSSVVESPRVRIETVETVPGQDIAPVSLSSFNSFDGQTYRVTGGTEVLLDWADEFARTAASVEFFYYSPANPSGASIGLDPTMLDGASLPWTVPANANGQLTARVLMPDGMYFETPRVGIIAQ